MAQLASRTLSSLHGYRREWASADALAAVTLLVIAVPEQLATSRLAGMPPITGLYAFVAGTVLFAFLGSSPNISVGADSTIAPLFAVGIAAYATQGSSQYIALVGILAVLVGIIVALVGLLRLGWISEFLSAPIIIGFLAGVAVVIVIHQLPDLLGIHSTGGSNAHRIRFLAGHLSQTNSWSTAIGIGVLVIVVLSERINRRIPGALIGLIGSAVLVGAANLRNHGVEVLGRVAHGAPRWGLHGLSWSTLGKTAPVSGVVALVVVIQVAATARAFPAQAGYREDVNPDFVAVGAGSIIAGLAGAFPVNASPPRTAAVTTAGGKTQAACLAAAAAVILLIPAAGILKDVPVATLAGVLFYVAGRIFRVKDMAAIARFNLIEFGLAIVTLLTVALFGVEQGIGVAVGLAILDRTFKSARPQLHVLGRVEGSTSWAPVGIHGVSEVPGILVVLFATPLWYANAVHFRSEFEAAIARAGSVNAIVLDAIGMGDIDYTGEGVLAQLLDEFDRQHIRFHIARAGDHVRESLARGNLLARIGEEHLYPTVDDAVRSLAAG